MKKLLIAGILSCMLSLGLMAGSPEFVFSVGGNADYLKTINDKDSFTGTSVGVGIYNRENNVAMGMDFETSFMSDYQTYTTEINFKYYFDKNLAGIVGVNYTYYDFDNYNKNVYGLGMHTKFEYTIVKGFGIYGKYSFENMDSGFKSANKLSTGIFYKF